MPGHNEAVDNLLQRQRRVGAPTRPALFNVEVSVRTRTGKRTRQRSLALGVSQAASASTPHSWFKQGPTVRSVLDLRVTRPPI